MSEESQFEIKNQGRQLLLRVHPPEGGRKKAKLQDIEKALRQRKVEFRHEILFDIFRRSSGEFEPLAIHDLKDYQVEIEVSPDTLHAWLTVIPPDVGERKLDPAIIKQTLEGRKVEKGIMYDQIRRILDQPGAHERVLVAQGKPKTDGVNGTIEFLEQARPTPQVSQNTMDLRELNLINNVHTGDLIARITHPTPGENGFNVHAQVLKAIPGKRAKFKVGRNVKLTDDGTEMFATKEGYVVRTGSKISVEHVLQVENVDGDTGHIRFHGVVKVLGNVEDAFELEAEKGIEVGGSVGKAKVRCGGDIVIKGGVNGGDVQGDGNLNAIFLADAKVRVQGAVTVRDYILHSDVVANGPIQVQHETDGFIQGGRVRSNSVIFVPTAGSEISEDKTVFEVGGGVTLRAQYDTANQRLQENREKFNTLRLNLAYLQRERSKGALNGKQGETYENTLDAGLRLRNEILSYVKQYHDLAASVQNPESDHGFIFISRLVNPGTSLQVQTGRVIVSDPLERVAYTFAGGGIKALPYGEALKMHKLQSRKRQSRNRPLPQGQAPHGPNNT